METSLYTLGQNVDSESCSTLSLGATHVENRRTTTEIPSAVFTVSVSCSGCTSVENTAMVLDCRPTHSLGYRHKLSSVTYSIADAVVAVVAGYNCRDDCI